MQSIDDSVELELPDFFTTPREYDLQFESREKYLYAFAKGRLDITKNRVDCWQEILDRCRSEGYSGLLVYQESPLNPSLVERFDAAAQIVALGVHRIAIAYVDADPDAFEHNEFCALVARNRGANISMFHTVEEAHEWLS